MMALQDIGDFVGLRGAHAYTKLLALLQVQRATILRYSSPPPLQNRVELSRDDHLLIQEALKIRKETKLPFWNALFSAALTQQYHSPELVFAAFFHNGPGEPMPLQRPAIESGALKELVENETNIGLSSEVLDVDGNDKHIPMLDFHCDISPHNEELASLVCEHLMPQGHLLIDSGDSYHACGLGLVSSEQRIQMLGKALLVAPIVDSFYIAHQLQQATSSIRISKGGRAQVEPKIVRVFAPPKDELPGFSNA